MKESRCLIIAEAGINHNGSIELARQLIDIAKEAGADIIKFQTFKADKVVSKTAQKAVYQKQNTNDAGETQYAMLKKLELDEASHLSLLNYCQQKDIQFLSTGFDIESIDLLEKLGMSLYKIPSGEITNKPYLQHIAGKRKPVIMSTGISNLAEIEDAIKVMIEGGLTREQITILHCNTEYPTPMKDVNLKAMLTIRDAFKVKIGYSDHTLGIEVPIAAVALGAQVIEKHFTIDRKMPGPDHKASLEPLELKAMVKAIRNIELAISGDGLKEPSPSELPNKPIARRSIHLKMNLKKGTILAPEHLTMKRPGDGLSPMMINIVLGKEITTDLPADHKLNWQDFK